MRRNRVGMLASPAFAGHLFAVLCVMAIWWHDIFWRSGNDR
jgi:hypothetical protein